MDKMINEQGFVRQHLAKAIFLELQVLSDGRMKDSTQGWQIDVNDFLSDFNKSARFSTGPLLYWVSTYHPVAALATGALGLAAAAVSMTKFKDYGKNSEEMFHAFRIMMFATPDQINQINLSVIGGLQRFANERVIAPFEERLKALHQVLSSSVEISDEAKNRIAIYEAGLQEIVELEKIISIRLQYLISQDGEARKSLQKQIEQRRKINNESMESLEVHHQAGLISHAEYKEKKAGLKFENAEARVVNLIVGLSEKVKDGSLLGEETVKDFSEKFFDYIHVEASVDTGFRPEPSEAERAETRSNMFIVLTLALVALLFIAVLMKGLQSAGH